MPGGGRLAGARGGVARLRDVGDPAVVTVGSLHGGTRRNIIPDQVDLQLTVRTYSDETRKQVLGAVAEREVAQTVNYKGIGFLVTYLATVGRAGGSLRLAAASDKVRDTLRLIRLDTL